MAAYCCCGRPSASSGCADGLQKRCPIAAIRHAMSEMVMSRVLAIACGHEDAIDLDRLRHDPLMKLAVGRCPESGAALASQSTISRLENAPSKTEAARLAAALLDQFGTTVKPGKLEILDIDDTFCGAWHPAARVLERASRRARLCVDAPLARRGIGKDVLLLEVTARNPGRGSAGGNGLEVAPPSGKRAQGLPWRVAGKTRGAKYPAFPLRGRRRARRCARPTPIGAPPPAAGASRVRDSGGPLARGSPDGRRRISGRLPRDPPSSGAAPSRR
jgi:hypothetical protein